MSLLKNEYFCSNYFYNEKIRTDGMGDTVNYIYSDNEDRYPTTATASQGVLKYECIKL